jgi:hypothetical protein
VREHLVGNLECEIPFPDRLFSRAGEREAECAELIDVYDGVFCFV